MTSWRNILSLNLPKKMLPIRLDNVTVQILDDVWIEFLEQISKDDKLPLGKGGFFIKGGALGLRTSTLFLTKPTYDRLMEILDEDERRRNQNSQ